MSSFPPGPETPPLPSGGGPPPPTYVLAPPPSVTLPKSPAVAVVLSLCPGLGQVYNGQIGKAFAFFGGWLAAFYSAITIDPMPFVFMFVFVHLYNLVDAWKSAHAINVRFLGGRNEPETDMAVESPVWGAVLVVVGSVILMHNLGWLDLAFVHRWWPVLLIAAGVVFIQRSFEARKAERRGTGDGGGTL
jgi:TM2 domain-containing membrane protein YozV